MKSILILRFTQDYSFHGCKERLIGLAQAQFAADRIQGADKIWHYTIRNIIANISSLHPAGGWGTEIEGRMMNSRPVRWLLDLPKS